MYVYIKTIICIWLFGILLYYLQLNNSIYTNSLSNLLTSLEFLFFYEFIITCLFTRIINTKTLVVRIINISNIHVLAYS